MVEHVVVTMGVEAVVEYDEVGMRDVRHGDRRTLMGRRPKRSLGQGINRRIGLVAGCVGDRQAMLDAGFDRVIQVTPDDIPLDMALKPDVARNNMIKVIIMEEKQ